MVEDPIIFPVAQAKNLDVIVVASFFHPKLTCDLSANSVGFIFKNIFIIEPLSTLPLL